MSMLIQTLITYIEPRLADLGWQKTTVDETNKGPVIFTDKRGRVFSFEIGNWWPEGAHHLDDEPGLIACIEDKTGKTYLGDEGTMFLHTSPDNEIHAAADCMLNALIKHQQKE